MKIRVKSAIGFLVLPLLISACTPPMPPEFKAELAERYVTCVPGEVAVSAIPALTEIAQTWIDGLVENCSDMSATLVDPEVDTDTKPDIFITRAGETPACNAAASSPVGLDAVAVAVSVEGLDGVIFTPALLHRALSGGMASWADPELQELNSDIELTDTPVVLRASTQPQDIAALNEWMSRIDSVGWPNIPSGLISDPAFDAEATTTDLETEGTIAVVPASLVTNNSVQTVSIQTEPDIEPTFMTVESVISAGTQMAATTAGSVVTAELDSSLPAIPAAGNDVASLPWQALNQFTITVCSGANEMAGRAFARYALRLDSQGAFTSYGLTELPEQIRVAGVEAVSQGLPEPTIPPSDAPEAEVPTEDPTEEPLEDPTDMPSEEPLEEVTDAATPEPTS
jgi:ABC-type phosphate transport system substrate-binding protein